jgi:hypothetical protein
MALIITIMKKIDYIIEYIVFNNILALNIKISTCQDHF